MWHSKPTTIWSQCVSDVSIVNTLLVVFYDIYGNKEEVLFFCSDPDTTRSKKSR
jgi:hypothetical protein